MKKRDYIVIALIITLGVSLLFHKEIVKAGGGVFGLNAVGSNPDSPSDTSSGAISTSTLNYLTPGAGTTTSTVFTQGSDQITYNIFGVASGTPTDLRFRVEISYSTTTAGAVFYPAPADIVTPSQGLLVGGGNVGTTTALASKGAELIYTFASSTQQRIATSSAMNNTFDQNTTFGTSFTVRNIGQRITRLVAYIPTMGDTLNESTALANKPAATSTNAGIFIQPITKDPY